MTVDKYARIIGGSLILISIALAIWVNLWWLLLAMVIGAGLVQSAFTDWCPLEIILKKFGVKGCCTLPQQEQKKQQETKSSCCEGH